MNRSSSVDAFRICEVETVGVCGIICLEAVGGGDDRSADTGVGVRILAWLG